MKPTPEILKFSQSIRDQNDRYKEFVFNKLFKSDDVNDRLKQSTINSSFVSWMKTNYPDESFHKTKLTKTVEKRFSKMKITKFSDGSGAPGWKYIKF